MSSVRRPHSLMTQALERLAGRGEMTFDELLRELRPLCQSHTQTRNLSSELGKRGYVERVVRLTRAGRLAGNDAVGDGWPTRRCEAPPVRGAT